MYHNADPKPEKRIKPPKPLKKRQQPYKATILNTLSECISFADKWFSEFIRLIDSDSDGFVKCYTCDEVMFWRGMDCGHFEDRKNMEVRYDERNCKPQCQGCNRMRNGEIPIFKANLIKEYGIEITEILSIKAKQSVKMEKALLLKIGNTYKQKVIELKKQKHLN